MSISLSTVRKDLTIVASVAGAAVTIAGVLVSTFANGPLHEVGNAAALAAPVLATILVVVQRVQQLLSVADTAPPNVG
jgi:hypothetical protein